VTLTGLTGEMKFGEVTTFTSNSSAATGNIIYASALGAFDMEVDYTYHVEIYDQKDQKIVKEAKDIMCTGL
jgi:hypothetical protein